MRHYLFEKTYHKYFAGFLIGLVALIAWPASQLTGRVGGLGITTPSAHLISYIITGDSKQLGWGVFLVLGIFIGVISAIKRGKALDHVCMLVAITGLSGIPTILFGLVGYTLLIYRFGLNRSLLCSALCVAAMIIPFVAIRAEKILEEKGREYMKNSLSLGLSREYALRKLILPVCSVELLGTVALGMAYGMGAVAPILYTGAVMQADVPHSLSDPFMSLPYHLYILVNNGFSLDYAYGTAFVLMLFLLIIQLICKFITYLRKDN